MELGRGGIVGGMDPVDEFETLTRRVGKDHPPILMAAAWLSYALIVSARIIADALRKNPLDSVRGP